MVQRSQDQTWMSTHQLQQNSKRIVMTTNKIRIIIMQFWVLSVSSNPSFTSPETNRVHQYNGNKRDSKWRESTFDFVICCAQSCFLHGLSFHSDSVSFVRMIRWKIGRVCVVFTLKFRSWPKVDMNIQIHVTLEHLCALCKLIFGSILILHKLSIYWSWNKIVKVWWNCSHH